MNTGADKSVSAHHNSTAKDNLNPNAFPKSTHSHKDYTLNTHQDYTLNTKMLIMQIFSGGKGTMSSCKWCTLP